MELISSEIPRDLFYSALWLSSLDFGQYQAENHFHEDIDAVAYIADLMSQFVTNEKFLKPAFYGDAGTLTERFIASGKMGKEIFSKENGDFALFFSGMFPERLARRDLRGFYEDSGAASYLRAFHYLENPTLLKLSRKFASFEGIITNARNNYMKVMHENNQIQIIPVYENINTRLARSN